MDVAAYGAGSAVRGGYLRQTGRRGEEKSGGFRDALSGALGTKCSEKGTYECLTEDGTPISFPKMRKSVPYSNLAKDGVITYNGVTFVCDYEKNAICLGDMSDPKKVLNIPLSGGGSLMVNRSEIGTLSKAIGMFSPEDVNLILRAIALDKKCQQELNKIDEMEGDPDNVAPTEEEE